MRPREPSGPDAGPWSNDYRDVNGASVRARRDTINRFVVLGFITAIAIPPVGFVVGLVLGARRSEPTSKQGWWIVALSVVAGIAWVLAVSTGLLNASSTTSPP